jgi:hypothetical protein
MLSGFHLYREHEIYREMRSIGTYLEMKCIRILLAANPSGNQAYRDAIGRPIGKSSLSGF